MLFATSDTEVKRKAAETAIERQIRNGRKLASEREELAALDRELEAADPDDSAAFGRLAKRRSDLAYRVDALEAQAVVLAAAVAATRAAADEAARAAAMAKAAQIEEEIRAADLALLQRARKFRDEALTEIADLAARCDEAIEAQRAAGVENPRSPARRSPFARTAPGLLFRVLADLEAERRI